MNNTILKMILLFTASSVVSFIFYVQGAKLEEKDKTIENVRTEKFNEAIKYKDSIIRYLQDSIHFVHSESKINPVNPILTVEIKSSSTSPKIDTGYYPISKSISRLIDSANNNSYNPKYRNINESLKSDSLLLTGLKNLYNIELNKLLDSLCNMSINLNTSRQINIRLIDKITTTVESIEDFIGRSTQSLNDAVEVYQLNTGKSLSKIDVFNYDLHPTITSDKLLKTSIDSLLLLIKNDQSRSNNNFIQLTTNIKSICIWHSSKYEYFILKSMGL